MISMARNAGPLPSHFCNLGRGQCALCVVSATEGPPKVDVKCGAGKIPGAEEGAAQLAALHLVWGPQTRGSPRGGLPVQARFSPDKSLYVQGQKRRPWPCCPLPLFWSAIASALWRRGRKILVRALGSGRALPVVRGDSNWFLFRRTPGRLWAMAKRVTVMRGLRLLLGIGMR